MAIDKFGFACLLIIIFGISNIYLRKLKYEANYYFLLPILLSCSFDINCNSNTSVDLKDFSIKRHSNIYSFTIATSNQDSITITRNN